VSYQAYSYVSFSLQLNENDISCIIKNSKHNSKESHDKSYSGIGLTNIRKSLELLFKNDYTLNINENDKDFEVQLKIPVYENKMLSH
jgi:LytS/YehU family sensor histidine kinase